jgi:putative heme-binding domain-containing protein
VFYSGSSDQALFENIQRGIPGTEMPGIYHEGKQIWQLVAFVRSLAKTAAPGSITGDPHRGQALYKQHGCNACHFIAGEGARLGPDLTYIGSARSVAYLKESILNPKAMVSSAWWPLEVTGKDGKVSSGYLLGEDSFHIRMIDQSEKLRSFARTELTRIDRAKGESRMPSYAGKFSDSELNDLLAYLSGLRRKVGER